MLCPLCIVVAIRPFCKEEKIVSLSFDPIQLLAPRRKITGISAILLPFAEDVSIDWGGFENHVQRTFDAGLVPAINMDTGYGNLIDDTTREETLRRTNALAGGRQFVAGVFVADQPGSAFSADAYRVGMDQIQRHSGTPIFFQSYGLIELPEDETVSAYQELAAGCDSFLFFELGQVFAPFGKIYSLEVYEQLMLIPNALGAKHSSLRRQPEWERLELRNRLRPDFKVFTGNDLGIDMVMYGSDYLLGLSTFAPDAFAKRDAMWESGDARFYELNDLLQYLGAFTFRDPAPAYKHSAAMFLKIRGMIDSAKTHPQSPQRPASDQMVLESIASQLETLMKESN